MEAAPSTEPPLPGAALSSESEVSPASATEAPMPEAAASSTYGPFRKVRGKSGPEALWRPPTMRQEDFVSIMQEAVPKLIDEIMPEPASGSASSSSHKRTAEEM